MVIVCPAHMMKFIATEWATVDNNDLAYWAFCDPHTGTKSNIEEQAVQTHHWPPCNMLADSWSLAQHMQQLINL